MNKRNHALANLGDFMNLYPGDGVIAGLADTGKELIRVSWGKEEDRLITPTITAQCVWGNVKIFVGHKRSYEINDLGEGLGYCVTRSSLSPPDRSDWEMFLLPLTGDAQFVADFYWEILSGKQEGKGILFTVEFIPRNEPLKIIRYP